LSKSVFDRQVQVDIDLKATALNSLGDKKHHAAHFNFY
jgi:hypothetical protein